jgi:hypothetical protein
VTIILLREVDDEETEPATKHPEGRIRACEHEGDELKAASEYEAMQQRAVQD